MRIIVFGADGFIGREVVRALKETHDVFRATRQEPHHQNDLKVDLMSGASIASAIKKVSPDALVNCAGIVDTAQDVSRNVTFTTNILQEALSSGLQFKSIVILGSAGEYGVLNFEDLPVNEEASTSTATGYGACKAEETRVALKFRAQHNLPIVVARIFNPLGSDMHPKFLTSRIINQLAEIESGSRTELSISRLDAQRDYISVKDVAHAIRILIEHTPSHGVYNIGSGVSTSNGELIDLILKHSKLLKRPAVVETATVKEPVVASQADISRIRKEFGWYPQYSLEDSIKEIMYDENK